MLAQLMALCSSEGIVPRLQIMWADGMYQNVVNWVSSQFQWVLEIVKKDPDQKGFTVLPHRWIVERTFAWLGRYRRLSKDYEYETCYSESMIRLAMIHIMVRRIAT